jgi:hypothetical protein
MNDKPEPEDENDDEFTGEVREVEVTIKGVPYILEVDIEDPNNLVIGSATKVETDEDVDTEEFMSDLDEDDWTKIEEAVEASGTTTIEGTTTPPDETPDET